jgi:hypothetical protein
MSDYTIKSEEEKRSFDTGAVRNKASGKGRFDLLPLRTLWDLAIHYEKGVESGYPDRNWEQGIPLSCFFDSGMRHAFAFFMGVEDSEDHLIAAIWNFVGLRETKQRIEAGILPKDLDDIPYTWKKNKTGYISGWKADLSWP